MFFSCWSSIVSSSGIWVTLELLPWQALQITPIQTSVTNAAPQPIIKPSKLKVSFSGALTGNGIFASASVPLVVVPPVFSPVVPSVLLPVVPPVLSPVVPPVLLPVVPPALSPVAPSVLSPVVPPVLSPVVPPVLSPVAPPVLSPVAPPVLSPPVLVVVVPVSVSPVYWPRFDDSDA